MMIPMTMLVMMITISRLLIASLRNRATEYYGFGWSWVSVPPIPPGTLPF
jgi:hypothetical protein